MAKDLICKCSEVKPQRKRSNLLPHLFHNLPRIAGESDRHGFKVDDEGPLVVGRHQAGRDVLTDGQRKHELGRTSSYLRRLVPQFEKWHLLGKKIICYMKYELDDPLLKKRLKSLKRLKKVQTIRFGN
jgi:hypothetical protein